MQHPFRFDRDRAIRCSTPFLEVLGGSYRRGGIWGFRGIDSVLHYFGKLVLTLENTELICQCHLIFLSVALLHNP
jgi:hypothetical protein